MMMMMNLTKLTFGKNRIFFPILNMSFRVDRQTDGRQSKTYSCVSVGKRAKKRLKGSKITLILRCQQRKLADQMLLCEFLILIFWYRFKKGESPIILKQ
jgi:hypothetical protein